MKCPFCGHSEDRVVDSRVGRDGEFIRRRRECLRCNRRYTTYEYIEDVLPDGGQARRPAGALRPRQAPELHPEGLREALGGGAGGRRRDRSDIEAKLHERAEKEVSSQELGDLVMAKLQRLDQVAYVRFASVYRQFKDIAQFMDEVKGLIKGQEGTKPKRPRTKG